MFIGGAWHAQVHNVDLGPHGDGPELVLPPVWHDLATGTSYALRNVNMVLRDRATGASKGAFDLPLFVALDVAEPLYVSMVTDAAMQYMVSNLGQPGEVPTQPDPSGNGHVRPSGLIVPPGRG
jgi:hypothetical protein